MNKFELVAKPSRVALSFALALGMGFLVVFVGSGIISRFTNWTATRTMPIALGIGAVVAVGMALSTLFNTIKRIELDEQALRLHMLSGAKKEYLLSQNQFMPKLTHQTTRGQHVGTTRALQIDGPHGTDTHTIGFSADEFNELVHRLLGRPGGGAPVPGHPGHATPTPGHAAQNFTGAPQPNAPTQNQAPSQPVRQPLQFEPQQFTLTRKPLRKYYAPWIVLTIVVLVAGVFAALAAAEDSRNPSLPFFVYLGFMLFALLCLSPMLVVRSRAAKLPKQVVVAPTWVSFDERTFNYSDLKVIQIKPPGTPVGRSAKILTKADERVIVELGYSTYTKIFPDYDRFADVLDQAGTAAAGVVRLDWS